MNQTAKQHCRCALSLIEFVVVIAMMAILMAVLLPAIKLTLLQTTRTLCMYNLKQIYTATTAYCSEYKSLPCGADDLIQDSESSPAWFRPLVEHHLRDPSRLVCPADPLEVGLLQGLKYRPQSMNTCSYGMNDFLRQYDDGKLLKSELNNSLATTLLFADLGPDTPVPTGAVGAVPARNAARLVWDDGFDPGAVRQQRPWVTKRHGDSINVITFDGGVRGVDTTLVLSQRVQPFYPSCAKGGCALCRALKIPHYTFASSGVYWWTGELRSLGENP